MRYLDPPMLNAALRFSANLAIVFAICATVSIAHAQIYKCKDSTGKTTYSDVSCDSRSKPLKLNDDSKAKTDPHMCEQLLDETNRLAAEASRNTKASRTQRSETEKRRKALTRQYEARCAGISRSK